VTWTERAEADLDEIWHFTRRKWGEEQADRYITRLSEAVDDEGTRRLQAKRLNIASPGWFRMREVRHFIYFRQTDVDIVVIRVLHDSMDETLHLP
jgi:toxin ParE1/3/4